MVVLTWNINGYRSTNNKGLFTPILELNPDFICLQEIKMNEEIVGIEKYHAYYNFANKKGYSGVAIFCKEKPINIVKEIGFEQFDSEGRFLLLEYPDFILINLYIPHGGRQKENHEYKFAAINKILDVLKSLNKNIILCTDFNIAHTELDLTNYKTNYDNNMFSLPERQKIDEILSLGFVDALRYKTKENGIYSWWSHSFNARERNMGWRIDYIFLSKNLANKIEDIRYLKDYLGSDHCPVILELTK